MPPISGGCGGIDARISRRAAVACSDASRLVRRPARARSSPSRERTREVECLDYEAYREMAEERIAAIVAECIERHGLQAAAAEHRVGRVALGEPGVVVAASAAHREEAFAGARESDRPDQGRGADLEARARRRRSAAGSRAAVARERSASTHLDDARRRAHGRRRRQAGERSAARARARGCGCRRRPRRRSQRGNAPKGEVLGTARLAGIQAAKQTRRADPARAPARAEPRRRRGARSTSTTGPSNCSPRARRGRRDRGRDGGDGRRSVAALTVYDMVKGLERGVAIEAGRAAREDRRAPRAGGATARPPWISDDACGGADHLALQGARRGPGRERRASSPSSRATGRRDRRARDRRRRAGAIEERLRHWATPRTATWS